MADKIIEGVRARAFVDILQELDKGRVSELLDQKLLQVSSAAEESGQPGTVIVKLKIKPAGDGSAVVGAEIKAEIPHKPTGGTEYFFDRGVLRSTNPNQLGFPEPSRGPRNGPKPA